jgi:hypothetical protein
MLNTPYRGISPKIWRLPRPEFILPISDRRAAADAARIARAAVLEVLG